MKRGCGLWGPRRSDVEVVKRGKDGNAPNKDIQEQCSDVELGLKLIEGFPKYMCMDVLHDFVL